MEMKSWAQSVQQEVFEFWKENHRDHKPGIQVFYSPIQCNPELMIAGFNPGGSFKDFENDLERFERGDFTLPQNHHYLSSDIDIAIPLRERIFRDRRNLLEKSVKLNIIPFRTKNLSEWRNLPDDERNNMIEYSRDLFYRLVGKTEPEYILVEGMSTWNKLQNWFDLETEYQINRLNSNFGNQRLFCVSSQSEPRFFGIPHPSGAHGMRNEEWSQIREELFEYID